MSARPGYVQTVTGPIAPGELGATLMHEHLLCDITPPGLAAANTEEVPVRLDNVWQIRHEWCAHAGNNRLQDADLLAGELRDFAAAGGSAVVDLTTRGIGPDRCGLAELSRRAAVHVIAGCGYYTEAYLSAADRAGSVDDFVWEMVAALAPRGDAPAGIIGEIGCSDVVTPTECRILEAAAIAQQQTGAAINLHPSRRVDQLWKVLTLLRRDGADLSRVVISHVDRTVFDEATLYRLADTGAVIEYDFFGIESSYYPFDEAVDLPNDGQRVRWIRALIERGHGAQITISHDLCTRTRLRRLGGHGYAHILANVVPLMSRRGISREWIDTLLVHTPRRLLTLP